MVEAPDSTPGDIVERLRGMRDHHQHAPLYNDAAAEIERLRAALREIADLDDAAPSAAQLEVVPEYNAIIARTLKWVAAKARLALEERSDQ